MIYTHTVFVGGIKGAVFFLNNHYSNGLGLAFILLLTILSVIGLLKRSNFFTNVLLWLVMLNINSYLYSTLTAGDYLLNQLLFFNIFFSLQPSSQPVLNDLKTAFHNMALAGIKIQVCLVYFLTAWFKLTDPLWLNGTAVYRIFQIPEYTNALLICLPFWFCLILNYITIGYQLLFPVLIWFRRFKIWFFAFGILQHLLIAFAMGLFSFGIVMIICYILFLKYDYSKAVPSDFADKAENSI